MLERQILAALIRQDSWLKYGGLFAAHFFSTDTYRQLYSLIERTWSGYEGTSTVIPRNLLTARIEETALTPEHEGSLKKTLDLLLEEDFDAELVDGLVKDVLYRWRTQDFLVSAAQELEDGGLDLYSLSSKLSALARAVDAESVEEDSLIDSALSLLEEESVGTVYTTGLEELDFQLKGGLWEGEEGIVIAPSFRGKTWALVHFGATSLLGGTPVQHHTCEISRRRTAIRYYQSMLTKGRLWILENKTETQAMLRDRNLPEWSIRDHSGGCVTTSRIRKEVGEFVDKCDTAPLIVIDYIDLLAPSNRKLEGRFALTAIAQELREIAAEFGVGLWTATQANRPSWDAAIVKMSDVSEAIGKVEKADVIITLNQTAEEKACSAMRFVIEKARERVLSKHIIPSVALSETQQFRDVTDGFDGG